MIDKNKFMLEIDDCYKFNLELISFNLHYNNFCMGNSCNLNYKRQILYTYMIRLLF